MRYDAVWTVDHHPSLCGVAKFSHQLADRLGVPCVPIKLKTPGNNVLISVRQSELPRTGFFLPHRYSLFLHDWDGGNEGMIRRAERVFAANPVIAEHVRVRRPDVQTVFAPAMIQGNHTRGAYQVLTFGMAHKLKAENYRALKEQLDRSGQDYTVSVSTAVHEGSPWDATARVADELRAIFGDRLRVLGYLADDALAKELQECDLVALFYEPALRANNTTYWAAKAAGKPVVTNRDEHSPPDDLDVSWDALVATLGVEVPCAPSR